MHIVCFVYKGFRILIPSYIFILVFQIVLTLRALGNSGHTSSATATVNSCISRKDNPMEVRIAAIEAFRRASCDNDVCIKITLCGIN